ncbi:TraR/DksA family transcriptional regulator [Candidatus Parcubacteria bacterium]|nr:TraR/DksA family transcriptional regulator [Candidatus Parcubacteria bacterium]
MDKKFLKEIKKRLEKEKAAIEKELGNFAKKDPKLKGDWDSLFPQFDGGSLEEAADEVEEYSTRLPIEFSLELKLRDINLALENIEKGRYGKCEKCGKLIPKDRLKIFPEARTCNKCKK